jgi:hypothetical protein
MEVAVAKFELLSRHLTGDFEESHKIYLAKGWFHLRDLIPARPE